MSYRVRGHACCTGMGGGGGGGGALGERVCSGEVYCLQILLCHCLFWHTVIFLDIIVGVVLLSFISSFVWCHQL